MIPKIIHYCWFGGNPLPESAKKCIESWRKFFPGYEIKEWNESNFDVCINAYVEEAYKAKKYAFVSDYARFWIIYNYGGVYFDTDVEVLKPFDNILERGAFMGFQKMDGENMNWAKESNSKDAINPGLGLAATPGLGIIKKMLDFYNSSHFISCSGGETGTVVHFTTNLIHRLGIHKNTDGTYSCEGVTIYPDEYFDPMNYYTGDVTITPQTHSFHHYAATWVEKGKAGLTARTLLRIRRILLRLRIFVRRTFH